MSAANSTLLTFIDTNIWLYAFNDSQDIQKTWQAKQIIRQTPQVVISSQIINEVCNNLLRKFGAGETDIRKLVRSLYRKYVVWSSTAISFYRRQHCVQRISCRIGMD